MTRTRDMMLTEPGALIRRMFRDLDPWLETARLVPRGPAQERCGRSRGCPRSR